MAVLEINNPSVYELLELRHEIGRASVMRFRKVADLGDSPQLGVRSEVVFTVSGVVWFHGFTLPAKPTIGPGQESLEYTAADPLEWLAHNPADEVNLKYNHTSNDAQPFDYPSNQSVLDIIATELASLVPSKFKAIDASSVEGVAGDIVPPDFDTKGKTFLGLLDALCGESPGLSYWYDPTTYTGTHKGTLRLLSTSTPLGRATAEIVLPFRGHFQGSPASPAQNCESFSPVIDISGSYDTVEVYGWGDMKERMENAASDWATLPAAAFGNTAPYLRQIPFSGEVEAFIPGPGGGVWRNERELSVRPWHPNSDAPGYSAVGRRFRLLHDIVDLRITRREGSPPTYDKQQQSMWVQSILWTWDLGLMAHIDSFGGMDEGVYRDSMKQMDFGDPAVYDNDGSVAPNATAYPDYPTLPANPLWLDQPVPSGYDQNKFLAHDPFVRRTNFVFPAFLNNQPFTDHGAGPSTWYTNLLSNTAALVVFKFWLIAPAPGGSPRDPGVRIHYTGSDDLVATATAALGYDRTLRLYDQRLFKYTNMRNVVLRDDTSILQTYADMVLEVVGRARVYGEAVVDTDPATVLSDWVMGGAVQVLNWHTDGGTYSVPAPIQGLDLTLARDQHRLTVKFDRSQTYEPLTTFYKGREFYEGNAQDGFGGMHGQRGNREVRKPPEEPKKPKSAGVTPDLTFPRSNVTQSDAPAAQFVRGRITARSASAGVAVTYNFATLDGGYTGTDAVPFYRVESDGTEEFAAAVGTECLVGLFKQTDGSVLAQLLMVSETFQQYFVRGTVTARSAASGTPNLIVYSWITELGGYTGTGSTPAYRPYTDAPQIIAAEVGTACQILVTNTSAVLWSVQEKLDFEACDTGGSAPIFETGDGQVTGDEPVVGISGEDVVSGDGDVVYADFNDGAVLDPDPYAEIVTSVGYGIVFNESGDTVVRGQDPDAPVVADDYFDSLLVSSVSYIVAVASNAIDEADSITSPEGSSGSSSTGG